MSMETTNMNQADVAALVPFDEELATYEQHKNLLLANAEGQYVVVSGNSLIGPYASHTAAYSEGIRTFGDVPILLKQVQRDEAVFSSPFIGVVRADPGSVCQYFT